MRIPALLTASFLMFTAEILAQENGIKKIPIIFHVIHNGDEIGSGNQFDNSVGSNIHHSYIYNQIAQINNDFRRVEGTSGFSDNPVSADIEIEFCLATIDPEGFSLPEAGIDRVDINELNLPPPPYTIAIDSDIETLIKPATIWNPEKYLNVWVLPFDYSSIDADALNASGYATFPTESGLDGLEGGFINSDTTDGVVVDFRVIGSTTNENFIVNHGYEPDPVPETRMGRTLTHELGHFFGLLHPWGTELSCFWDDYCADTPRTNVKNSSCSPNNSCSDIFFPGQDMIENYMDYTHDDCQNTFTHDQKSRIIQVLANSPRRSELSESNACQYPEEYCTTPYPAPNSLGAQIDQSLQGVNLVWAAPNSASDCEIELRNNNDFEVLTFQMTYGSEEESNFFISNDLLSAFTPYSWKIRCSCENGTVQSDWSISNSFMTNDFSIPEIPDLDINDCISSSVVIPAGETITFTASVISNNFATNNAQIAFYLSDDQEISSDDQALTQETIGSIEANQEVGISYNLQIPFGTDLGVKHVIAKLNPYNTDTNPENDICTKSIQIVESIETSLLNCDFAIPLPCGLPLIGTTSNGTSNVNTYGCWSSSDMTGPEKIYGFELTDPSAVEINLVDQSSGSLVYFLLGSCNPNDCIIGDLNDATVSNLSPGQYYIVVDGFDGSEGDFEIGIECIPQEAVDGNFFITDLSLSHNEVNPGQNVFVECYQNFQGSTSSNLDPYVGYFLSSDPSWDSSDAFLGDDQSLLDEGDPSDYEMINAEIPSEISEGQYFILAVSDYDWQYSELIETDNVAAIALNVVIPDQGEFWLTDFEISPLEVLAGGTMDIDVTVNASINGSASIQTGYYLSTDDIFDASDTFLDEDGSSFLAPFDLDDSSGPDVIIPDDLAVGQYYIIIVADYLNEYAEPDESNNIVALPFSIVPEADNFSVNVNAIYPSIVVPGGRFYIEAIVQYQGTSEEVLFPISGVYLSDDEFLSDDDIFLNDDQSELSAEDLSDTEDERGIVPLDIPYGEYYVIWKVDHQNEFGEINEFDNTSFIPLTIAENSAIYGNFFFTNSSINSTTVVPEGNVEVSFDLNYSGTFQYNLACEVTYYYSLDPILDDQDIFIESDDETLSANDISDSVEEMVRFPDSLNASSFYLIIKIDADELYTESNENDNILSFAMTLTNNVSGNFNITNPSISDTSPITGDQITLTCTHNYSGSLNSETAVKVGYFLSSDNIFSEDDLFFGESTCDINANDTSDPQQGIFDIPLLLNEGDYHVLFVSDYENIYEETNENDNLVSIPINISSLPNAVDLIPTSINISDSLFTNNNAIDVDLVIQNIGTASSGQGFDIGYYLTTNGNIGAESILLELETIGDLESGEEVSLQTSLSIPSDIPSGEYQFTVLVDVGDMVLEFNENNNTLSSSITIIEVPQLPDLILSSLSLSEDSLSLNQTIGFSSFLKNDGNAAHTISNYSVFISTDELIDESDFLLDEGSVPTILEGDSILLSESFNLGNPGIYGDVFILVQLDSEGIIEESNEDNNFTSQSFFLKDEYNVVLYQSICQGESITAPDGSIVSSAGEFSTILTSSTGLDSLVTMFLFVNPSYTFPLDLVGICPGDDFTLPDGQVVQDEGVYEINLQTVLGCDSSFVIQVIHFVEVGCTDPSACNYDPWAICNSGLCDYSCDCPGLQANIGDPCDDLNPDTFNDFISEDCECTGMTNSITLTYPTGGETFASSDSVLVEWDFVGDFDSFVVDFTIDGGGFYEFVDSLEGDLNSLWVVIPIGIETFEARVRIIGELSSGGFLSTESDDITIVNTSGDICNFQNNLNHVSYPLLSVQTFLLNQGVPINLVSLIDTDHLYRITLRGGGGVNTRTEMILCLYEIIPEFCFVKGTSDAPDPYRTSIGITSDFAQGYGFNGLGWTDVTSYTQSSNLFISMDSEFGTNTDSRIELYVGTNETVETLGALFVDTNSDDFGGGSVRAVNLLNTGSIALDENDFLKTDKLDFNDEIMSAQSRTDLNERIKIQPNPVTEFLNVTLTSAPIVESLRILNLQGEVFVSSKNQKAPISIDVSALSAGVYILEAVIQNNKVVYREKFVKY